MTLGPLLAVAAGGVVGAPTRHLLDRAVTRRAGSDLPWGTVVVNVSGALLLGILTGLALSDHLPAVAMAWLGTGFCGAYTTFSTFTFETLRLAERGRYRAAAWNVLGSVAVGLAVAGAGLALGLAV